MRGDEPDAPPPPGGMPRARAAAAARAARAVLVPLAAAYAALYLVETPRWCARVDSALCDSPLYPSFGLPRLGAAASLAATLAFLSAFGLEILVSRTAHGYFGLGYPLRRAQLGLVFMLLVEAIAIHLMPSATWRAAPFLRAALLVSHSHALRQQLRVVWAALVRSSGVVALLVLFILYAAWLATLIFPASTEEGQDVLPSLAEAAWQLLILASTANFPDVMMPAYSANRVSVLFFGSFVCIGCFFLMNVILATVYESHRSSEASEIERSLALRAFTLDKAFEVLDESRSGRLSRDMLEEMLEHLPESRIFSGQSERVAEEQARRAIFFSVLDVSGDGTIQREEFSAVADVLALDFRLVRARPALARRCMPESTCDAVARVVVARWFDHSVNALLVISALCLAVEGVGDDGSTPLSPLQLMFSLLFAVEVGLKLLFLPLNEYLSGWQARLDVIITGGSCAALAYVLIPNGYEDGVVVRASLTLRLLRLTRLLRVVHAFERVIDTFIRLLPAASRLFAAFALVAYVFGCIGMQLFGGLITTDESGTILPLDAVVALRESDFGAANYYPNSFNDLASACITLFELLVVNNWQVITSGYVAVAGGFARWFFILFYAVGVLVMLNVTISTVLDTYASLVSEPAAKPDRLSSGATLLHDYVILDASTIKGVATVGVFEVRLRGLPHRRKDAWRDVLRRLFSHRFGGTNEPAVHPPLEGQFSLGSLLRSVAVSRNAA